jgi:hypothetical protein
MSDIFIVLAPGREFLLELMTRAEVAELLAVSYMSVPTLGLDVVKVRGSRFHHYRRDQVYKRFIPRFLHNREFTLIRPFEASRIVGVDDVTLYKWAENGIVHSVKLPSDVSR